MSEVTSNRRERRRALQWLEKRFFKEALQSLEDAFEDNPGDNKVKQLIIETSVQRATALDLSIDRLAETCPHRHAVGRCPYHCASNSHKRTSRVTKALDVLDRAIRLDTNFVPAWWRKGVILADRKSDPEEAGACLSKLELILSLSDYGKEVKHSPPTVDLAKKCACGTHHVTSSTLPISHNPLIDLKVRVLATKETLQAIKQAGGRGVVPKKPLAINAAALSSISASLPTALPPTITSRHVQITFDGFTLSIPEGLFPALKPPKRPVPRKNFPNTPDTELAPMDLLFNAAEQNNQGKMSFAIIRGASLDMKNALGETCLIKAAQFGNLEFVQQVLNSTVLYSTSNKALLEILYTADNNGMTPLLYAAMYGDKDIALAILDAYKKIKRTKDLESDKNGLPALHLAAIHGHTAFVEAMLNSAGDIMSVDMKSPSGATALAEVCRQGGEAMARVLLRHKADIRIPDNEGTTPIILAARRTGAELVKVLLGLPAERRTSTKRLLRLMNYHPPDVAINNAAKDGLTALHHACWRGEVETVNLLLLSGADVNNPVISEDEEEEEEEDDHNEGDYDAKAIAGWTPLMIASYFGWPEVVQLLLKNQANLHICNHLGETAFHLAAQVGNYACTKLLLAAGADEFINNSVGTENALCWAARDNDPRLARLLIEYGTEVGDAAHLALAHSALGVFKMIAYSFELDPNALDSTNMSLLYAAASGSYSTRAAVQMLVGLGADPNLDIEGMPSALWIACHQGNWREAECLIDAGADLEAKFHDFTPILIAARQGHTKVVRILFQAGAEITTTVDGFDIVSLPIVLYYKDMLRELMSYAEVRDYLLHNENDKGRRHPAEIAAGCGNKDALDQLIAFGVNPAKILPGDTGGAEGSQPGLTKAAVMGNTQIAKLLLAKGADPNDLDSFHMTPLQRCIRDAPEASLPEMVELLLNDYNAAIEVSKEQCKFAVDLPPPGEKVTPGGPPVFTEHLLSPLSLATRRGLDRIVDTLLKKGANIDGGTHKHNPSTPLLLAIGGRHDHLLQLFLSKQPKVDNYDLDSGMTALHLAALQGLDQCVQALLERGANIHALTTGASKQNALHIAASMGLTTLCHTLIQWNRASKAPVDKGQPNHTPLQVNAKRQPDGYTALHLATVFNNLSTVELLLKVPGIEVDVRDDVAGCTPLFLAAKHGCLEVVKSLMNSNKADMFAKCRDPSFEASPIASAVVATSPVEYTPLAVAGMYKHVHVVEFLQGLMTKELDNMKERVKLESDLALLNFNLTEKSDKELKESNKRVKELEKELAAASAAQASTTETKKVVTALESKVSQLEKELATTNEAKKQFDSASQQLTASQQQVATTKKRIDEIEKELAATKQKLQSQNQLDKQLKLTKKQAEDAQKETTEHKKQIAEAQKAAAAAKAEADKQVAAMKRQLDAAKKHADDMSKEHARMKSQVETIAKENKLLKSTGLHAKAVVDEEPPEDITCPVTFEVMKDPVVTLSGHSYERAAVEAHLDKYGTDPISGEKMKKTDLRPNITLKKRIAEYNQAKKLLKHPPGAK